MKKMQNIFDEIRERLAKLRKAETRVQTPGGEVFVEQRSDGGGFTKIENPEPRNERVAGYVYDFKPDLQMAELCPGLFLGSQDVAHELDLMKSKNITHIINAASFVECAYPDDFKYKRLDIDDYPGQEILSLFESSIAFIDEAIMSGGAVFVHCNAGVSRSTTICLAYLMTRKDMSLDQAIKHTRAIRPIIRPNFGFMEQLEQYETQLRGSSS